ncbi:MAG: MFS transporter [Streptosporangiaceae bacterium]
MRSVTPASPAQASGTRPDGAPGIVGRLSGLTWAHLLNDGAANYLPGVLPAVLVAVHQPIQMAGVLMAALAIGQAAQPVTGWIAGRIGGRGLVITGLLASSLGGALIGLASSFWLLIGLLLVIGLGSALPPAGTGRRPGHDRRPAGVSYLGLPGRRRTRPRHLADHRQLDQRPHRPGGPVDRRHPRRAHHPVPVPLGAAAAGQAEPRHPDPVAAAPPPAGRADRLPQHPGPETYGVTTFVPIMWHVRGGSLVSGASIITTMIVVGVIGNLAGGHLADRFGRTPVLVISALATAALTPVMVYAGGAWIWATAAVLGIAIFLTASTTVLIGQDIFPENRSMGSGIALGLANAIGAVLVLGIGFLVNAHDVSTVFWVLGGISLAGTLVVPAFPRTLLRR